MKIADVVVPLECKVIYKGGHFDDTDVQHVVASDLMSDVLVVDKTHLLLVTSLPSDQAIRTSDIVGAIAVVVVNNKNLPKSMVALAREMDVTLLQTPMAKFETCVRLGELMRVS